MDLCDCRMDLGGNLGTTSVVSPLAVTDVRCLRNAQNRVQELKSVDNCLMPLFHVITGFLTGE